MPSEIDNLFVAAQNLANKTGVNRYQPAYQTLRKGTIIQFIYDLAKPGHDKTPLVIITGINDKYIWGLNLHYLLFPEIKRLLQRRGYNACNNPNFSYDNIKSDDYIVSAFRQYKKFAIRRMNILNCDYLLNVMASVRAVDPQEIEALRSNIREQLNRTINPTFKNIKQTEIR